MKKLVLCSLISLTAIASINSSHAAGWQSFKNPDGTDWTIDQYEQFAAQIYGQETSTGTRVTNVRIDRGEYSARPSVYIETELTQSQNPQWTVVEYNSRKLKTIDGIFPRLLGAGHTPVSMNLVSFTTGHKWSISGLANSFHNDYRAPQFAMTNTDWNGPIEHHYEDQEYSYISAQGLYMDLPVSGLSNFNGGYSDKNIARGTSPIGLENTPFHLRRVFGYDNGELESSKIYWKTAKLSSETNGIAQRSVDTILYSQFN